MLILIATPIGNLQDVSARAKEALSSCDLICCEDTRHTGLLFQALGIPSQQVVSFHKNNEKGREDQIIQLLLDGKNVGVVSDAGTPAISDPGSALVARCYSEGIPVTIIPGPCAFASAFALSGALNGKMQFLGFLPKPVGERREWIRLAAEYDGSTVVYESPNRLVETLENVAEVDGAWEVLLVRELTKIHEEVVRRPVKELIQLLRSRDVRGECALVLLPLSRKEVPSSSVLVDEVQAVRNRFGSTIKEAIEAVAEQYRISRRDVYELCLKSSNLGS